jgi:hypothetical protein
MKAGAAMDTDQELLALLQERAFNLGRRGTSNYRAGRTLRGLLSLDLETTVDECDAALTAYLRGREHCPPEREPDDGAMSFLDGWFSL